MNENKARARYTRALLFYVFAFAIAITILSVVLSDLIDAFRVASGSEGVMSSMISLGALLSLVSVLLLQGRVRTATILNAAGVLMAVMIGLTGLIQTYPVLLCCFFLFGLCVGFIDACANAFVVDLNGAQVGRYLGALHGSSGVGALSAPLLIQYLLSVMHWRNVYFVLAVIVAVPILLFVAVGALETKHIQFEASTDEKLKLRDVKGYLTNKFDLLLLICLLLYTCSMNGINLWTVRFVAVTLNAPALSALALSSYWICSTVSRFVVPRLSIPPIRAFVLGAVLGGVLMIMGVLLRAPLLLCILNAAVGLFSGHSIPTLIGIGAARYPGKTTLPSSLLVIMMYSATMLFPLIMGSLNAALTMQVSMIFPGICLLLAAAAGAVLMRVRVPASMVPNEL